MPSNDYQRLVQQLYFMVKREARKQWENDKTLDNHKRYLETCREADNLCTRIFQAVNAR